MKKGDYLATLLQSNKTIFSLQDIALLWQTSNTNATSVRLNYYIQQGHLVRVRRGLYAKNWKYNTLELATKICTPSYVSFETILAAEGLIFQFQNKITIASYVTRSIEIQNQTYSFKKMKNSLLMNSLGLEIKNETSFASKERAFLDTLYIHFNYHFDNLRGLDWNKVFTLVPIYDNKRLEKIVKKTSTL